MASILPRDLDLFRALDRGPLTVPQILKISATFTCPFPSERRLQRRLHRLGTAGLLRQWWYATEGPGGACYYTLSPESSRLLYGEDRAPARSWSAIGVARQHHARCLAEFLVHTITAVGRAGISLTDFHRENALDLTVGEKHLRPDAAFTLIPPGLPPLRFFVEIDNSTEPLSTGQERDSFQRKLDFYEALHDRCAYRFRVLGIVTKSAARLEHMIAAAATATHNRDRSLFYGARLSEFLAQEDPLRSACFRDHRGRAVAMVPSTRARRRPKDRAATRALARAGSV